MRIILVAALSLMLGLPELRAQAPKEVFFQSKEWYKDKYWNEAWFSGSFDSDLGERRASGLILNPHTEWDPENPIIREAAVYYPPVMEGELVPAIGHVYKVVFPEKHYEVIFERVPDKKLPKGVKPLADSFLIPLDRFDQNSYVLLPYVTNTLNFARDRSVKLLKWDRLVWVRSISNVKDEYVAKMQVNRSEAMQPIPKLPFYEVRIGDILVLGTDGHEVRNIVPYNKETGVIGWVELSPHPITGIDLKNAKNKVVPK